MPSINTGNIGNLLKNLPTVVLVITLSLGLSACGYQLRGDQDLTNLPASISLYADDLQLAKAVSSSLEDSQVKVTVAQYAISSEADSEAFTVSGLRFINTKTNREAVISDANGDATHWRYSVSTQMILGSAEESKTFDIQEYQQIELDTDSSTGTTNDRIVANTWQALYQTVAQRALSILNHQP